jgi:hypothetical protein
MENNAVSRSSMPVLKTRWSLMKMLAHVKEKATLEPSNLLPEGRGPPQASLFD